MRKRKALKSLEMPNSLTTLKTKCCWLAQGYSITLDRTVFSEPLTSRQSGITILSGEAECLALQQTAKETIGLEL